MSKRTICLMIDNWYAISTPIRTEAGLWQVRVFVDDTTLHTVEHKDERHALGAAALWASEQSLGLPHSA